VIVAYIDAYHHRFGVEPICRVLSEHDIAISPGTYYARRAQPVSDSDRGDAHMANTSSISTMAISRATWSRPMSWPARRIAVHNLSAPYTLRLARWASAVPDAASTAPRPPWPTGRRPATRT